MSKYTVDLHQHRFSAWAAARAASVIGRRFSVEICAKWLEEAGVDEAFTFDSLPNPMDFDKWHASLRQRLVDQARKISDFELSAGQAAKILNCYLKARFINAQTAESDQVRSIHPPIDRLLLSELIKSGNLEKEEDRLTLRTARDKGWSALTDADYESVVEVLKSLAQGEPMWSIEQYWRGFQ